MKGDKMISTKRYIDRDDLIFRMKACMKANEGNEETAKAMRACLLMVEGMPAAEAKVRTGLDLTGVKLCQEKSREKRTAKVVNMR